jgi:hypothetical protein
MSSMLKDRDRSFVYAAAIDKAVKDFIRDNGT